MFKNLTELDLELEQDYDLSGPVTYFEAYMFATKDKFIVEHDIIDGDAIVVGHDKHVDRFHMDMLSERKGALKEFNKQAIDVIEGFPDASGLSCFIVYFDADKDGVTSADVRYTYLKFCEKFMDWASENGRVGCVSPHLFQINQMPHAHVLYERMPGNHDEFQNFLIKGS